MRSWWSALVADVRRRAVHPPFVTAGAVIAVLATALRFGVILDDLPLDVEFRYGFSGRALSMGHWSTLVTSQFMSRDAFMAISLALSLILMLGLYEAIAGSWRALVVLLITAFAGPLLVAGGLGLGSVLGNEFAGRTLSTLDYGASAVTAGAGGALVAVLKNRGLRWFALAWVIGGLLVHRQLADWEHLFSFAVGFGLGCLLGVPAAAAYVHRRRSARGTPRRKYGPIAVGFAITAVVGFMVADALTPTLRTSVTVAGAAVTRPGTAVNANPVSAPPAVVSAPRVVPMSYPSPALGANHSGYIILPAGYDGSRQHYPVVELLHGHPGTAADIITGLDPLSVETTPGIPPFIGVAPDGNGPAVGDSEFADTPSQKVGTAVSDDLRAWVDAHYRTNGRWYVGGISSGGYGAAYLGTRRPGRYLGVCSLSGNFTPAGPAFRGDSALQRAIATPILQVSRSGPPTLVMAGTGDRRSLRAATAYAQALARVGQPYRLDVSRGGHDWPLWKAQLPVCLRYLLAPAPPR